MKISLLKLSRKKEVIKRIELSEIAEMIRENPEKDRVFKLRLNYQFYKPQRMPDGQITFDDQKHTVNLPRLLFAVEGMNYKEMQKGLKYNGLVVVEVNGLKTYEEAVGIRNQAARMDETVMAFWGASGKSVKIVCRGEMFRIADTMADQTTPPDGTPPTQEGKILPTREDEMRQFHKNLKFQRYPLVFYFLWRVIMPHISMSVVECGYQFGHFHLHLVKCQGVAVGQLISQLLHGLVKPILPAKSAIGIGMYLLQLTEEIVVILKQTVLLGYITVLRLEPLCTCECRHKQGKCYNCSHHIQIPLCFVILKVQRSLPLRIVFSI